MEEYTFLTEVLLLPKAHGRISILYNSISSSCLGSLAGVRGNWERELGSTVSDEWWDKALTRVNSTSSCARLNLIQFKVFHRMHFAKAKFSRLFLGMSDVCDKCGQAPADHTHTFFLCPKLTEFWSCSFETLGKALNITLDCGQLIAIFGVPPIPTSLTRSYLDVVAFASLIARRRILLQWKSPSPPIPSEAQLLNSTKDGSLSSRM